jgi:hypothetical protein
MVSARKRPPGSDGHAGGTLVSLAGDAIDRQPPCSLHVIQRREVQRQRDVKSFGWTGYLVIVIASYVGSTYLCWFGYYLVSSNGSLPHVSPLGALFEALDTSLFAMAYFFLPSVIIGALVGVVVRARKISAFVVIPAAAILVLSPLLLNVSLRLWDQLGVQAIAQLLFLGAAFGLARRWGRQRTNVTSG